MIQKISRQISSGSYVGLRMYFGKNFWRDECRLVDSLKVKSIILVTLHVTEQLKEELVKRTVTVLSCLGPIPPLSSVECWLRAVGYRL